MIQENNNCTGKKYCDCASEAFDSGANRDVVDELESKCPHASNTPKHEETIRYQMKANLNWVNVSKEIYDRCEESVRRIIELEKVEPSATQSTEPTNKPDFENVLKSYIESRNIIDYDLTLSYAQRVSYAKKDFKAGYDAGTHHVQAMQEEIINLINIHWRFDSYQGHLSNWHDKQDLRKEKRSKTDPKVAQAFADQWG